MAGCFLIGYGNGLSSVRQMLGPQARVFLFIGLLGGFTTFSSFGYETMTLARDSQEARALVNVAGLATLEKVEIRFYRSGETD